VKYYNAQCVINIKTKSEPAKLEFNGNYENQIPILSPIIEELGSKDKEICSERAKILIDFVFGLL